MNVHVEHVEHIKNLYSLHVLSVLHGQKIPPMGFAIASTSIHAWAKADTEVSPPKPAPGFKNAAQLRGVKRKLFLKVVQVVST